jgi:hypothetical protein
MKVKRKLDSSLQRGIDAENRLVGIIRSLRGVITWIFGVRLAGVKHDRIGIDMFISIKPLVGIKNIIVPIQVKSSLKGLMAHYIKYPLSAHPDILVIIVNGNYSDDNIKDYMIARLTEIRKKEACN